MLGVRNPLNFPYFVCVWVINHLGVVFSDAFGLLWVFGWISRKRDEICKSGQFRGFMPRRRDPMQWRGQEGGLGKLPVRQGVATVHSMEIFVFCLVLFFRCYEDLSIGLMRTL